jgi:hypothetical protein
MKTFVFTKNIENQTDEFKTFVGNPDEVKFVEMVCTVGDEVPLSVISNTITKISEHISKDAEVKFKTVVDKKMKSDEFLINVQI